MAATARAFTPAQGPSEREAPPNCSGHTHEARKTTFISSSISDVRAVL